MLTREKQAVFWIMEGAKLGEKRTQTQAADKFGITQAVVSLAMSKFVHEDLRPDGRRAAWRNRKGG